MLVFREFVTHHRWLAEFPMQRRLRKIVWFSLSLIVCSLLSACGPVMYSMNIRPAAHALEEAREAGAEEHAPYEYYYGLAHLEKAREEFGQGWYQDATECAEVAEEYGVLARDLARRRMREMGR